MAIDLDTFLVALYTIVDDLYQQRPGLGAVLIRTLPAEIRTAL